MMWKKFLAFILFLTVLSSFLPVSFSQVEPKSNGNITFQPNTIPDVNVYYDKHTFVFELERPQKTFFIRVEPFVIHDGKYYNMTQIIKFLKTKGWFEGNYRKLIDKAVNVIHYGYNITNLPQNVADKIDYLGFRLVDLNFPKSWMTLDTFEMGYDIDENWDGTPYNITHIRIEKANLIISFEDLYPQGFSVQHVNKTYVLVGQVKGKTDLIIDPITQSGSRIIVLEDTYTDIWDDIYQQDQTSGWGVSFVQGDNQYWFNSSIQIGNGTTAGAATCSASDDNVQVEIGDSTNNNGLTVTQHSTLTLGDSTEPQDGGALIINGGGAVGAPGSTRWYGTSNFYGVHIYKTTTTWLEFWGTDTWTNVIVTGVVTKISYHADTGTLINFMSEYVNPTSSGYTFTDSTFEGYSSGGLLRVGLSHTVVIEDSVFIQNRGIGEEVEHWSNFAGTLNLTDCTTDPTDWSWISGADGTTYYQFTFNLKTIFENNTDIQNANVTVWHVNGTQIFTELTNSTGQIAEKTLIRSRYTGEGTETNYNPYNLTITFTDYQTYTENFTLSEKTDWTIALQPSTPNVLTFNATFYLLGAVTFMPLLLIIGVWRKKRKNGS